MSEDNRIILDAANFDRSMPKWATEETLSRLENMIKTASKDEARILKETHNVLKDISRHSKDTARVQKTRDDRMAKDLGKIVKILGEVKGKTSSNKPDVSGDKIIKGITESASKDAKSINDNLSNIEKSTKELGNKLNSTLIDKNKADEKTAKESAKASKEIKDAIDEKSKKLADLIQYANDTADSSQKVLEDIAKHLATFNGAGSGQSDQNSDNGGGDDRNERTRFRDSMTSGMNDINRNLESIQYAIETQTAVTQGILSNSTSSDDLKKIIEDNAKRRDRTARRRTERSGNSMRDMFDNARDRANDNNSSASGLNKILGTLGKSLGSLTKLLRVLPGVGTMLSGAMLAATAVNKTAEYTFDAQKEFREMMDRGFTFKVLGAEAQEDGQSRLDGITVRETMTRNGIGLETATKVLENNTRLINNLGLNNTFRELGNVLGDANDPNSLPNKLGMTRDQLAVIAGDFYGMRNRVEDINESMSSLDRENAAKRFIRNVTDMSSTLGVSVEEIRQHIADFTKTDEYAATDAYFEGSEIIKSFAQSIFNDSAADMILNSIISPFGAVDERVRNLLPDGVQGTKIFEALQNMKTEFDYEEFQESDNQVEYLRSLFGEELIEPLTEWRDSLTSDELATLSAQNPAAAALFANMTQASVATQTEQTTTREETADSTSDIQKQATMLENEISEANALLENSFARLADSDSGREMIKLTMDARSIMVDAQLAVVGGLNTIADLLDGGPIPQILYGVRTGINAISRAIEGISSFFGFGAAHDDTVVQNEAGYFVEQLKNGGIFTEEQYGKLFKETKNEDGETEISLNDEMNPETFTNILRQSYSEAGTQEEREALIGLIKTFERGVETRDGTKISEELQTLMGDFGTDFRVEATQNLSASQRESIESILEGRDSSISAALSRRLRDRTEEEKQEYEDKTSGSSGFLGLQGGSYGVQNQPNQVMDTESNVTFADKDLDALIAASTARNTETGNNGGYTEEQIRAIQESNPDKTREEIIETLNGGINALQQQGVETEQQRRSQATQGGITPDDLESIIDGSSDLSTTELSDIITRNIDQLNNDQLSQIVDNNENFTSEDLSAVVDRIESQKQQELTNEQESVLNRIDELLQSTTELSNTEIASVLSNQLDINAPNEKIEEDVRALLEENSNLSNDEIANILSNNFELPDQTKVIEDKLEDLLRSNTDLSNEEIANIISSDIDTDIPFSALEERLNQLIDDNPNITGDELSTLLSDIDREPQVTEPQVETATPKVEIPEIPDSELDAEIERMTSTLNSLISEMESKYENELERNREQQDEIEELRELMSQSTIDSSYKSLEALKEFSSVADEEDLLDTDKSVEDLISISNRLLAEGNKIARLNVQSSTEQRESINTNIQDLDTNVEIGNLTINTDEIIDIDPIINSMDSMKSTLSGNLEDLYLVLGGRRFGDPNEPDQNYQNRSGNSRNLVANDPVVETSDEFEALFENLVKQESGDRQFDSNGNPLTSWAGAVGAAQIMPETAKGIARKHGMEFDEERFRHDEEYNKDLGRLHLKDLLERYDGDSVLTALAYNAGIGGPNKGDDGVERMMALYGDPRKGEISHEELLDIVEQNHSGDRNSWGVQSVPYARKVSLLYDEEANGPIVDMDNLRNNYTQAHTAEVDPAANYNEPSVYDTNNSIFGNARRQIELQEVGNTYLHDIRKQLTEGVINTNDSVVIPPELTENIYSSIESNMPDDTENYIDRDEIRSIVQNVIQEQEAKIQREMSERGGLEEEETDPMYDFTTPNENENENGDFSTVINSINTSNERIVGAIERNTRIMSELMNKII